MISNNQPLDHTTVKKNIDITEIFVFLLFSKTIANGYNYFVTFLKDNKFQYYLRIEYIILQSSMDLEKPCKSNTVLTQISGWQTNSFYLLFTDFSIEEILDSKAVWEYEILPFSPQKKNNVFIIWFHSQNNIQNQCTKLQYRVASKSSHTALFCSLATYRHLYIHHRTYRIL